MHLDIYIYQELKNKPSSTTTNPEHPENNHITKWAVARLGGTRL